MRSGELRALEWRKVDFETNLISVDSSYDNKEEKTKSTKSGHWRHVPMNTLIRSFLLELKLRTGHQKHVLPYLEEWERGEQAEILKKFLKTIGVRPVRFHTLRACFATHLLDAGVDAHIVMQIGGWRDLKAMQRYVRLGGISVDGATDGLNFLS